MSEEIEDINGEISIRKLQDRQHNGLKKQNKRTNNDLQNITHKTKDLKTRTSLKTGKVQLISTMKVICIYYIYIES